MEIFIAHHRRRNGKSTSVVMKDWRIDREHEVKSGLYSMWDPEALVNILLHIFSYVM